MEILVTALAAAPEPVVDSPSPVLWRNVVLLAAIAMVVGIVLVRRWRRPPHR
jgi:hypothetical protein